MGGGESKNSQLQKYGGLLNERERETLRAVFGNIAGDTEANTVSPQQFKVIYNSNSIFKVLLHQSTFHLIYRIIFLKLG